VSQADDFRANVVAACSDLVPVAARDQAIAHYVETGQMARAAVASCVQLAGRFADHHGVIAAPHVKGGSKASAPAAAAPLPADVILTSDQIVKIVRPWVEAVRVDVFGSAAPPFTDLKDVEEWMRNHRTEHPDFSDASREDSERAALRDHLKRVEELAGRECVITSRARRLRFMWPTRDNLVSGNIPAPVGSPAYRLRVAADQISEATFFPASSVLRWVLLGIEPVLPAYRITAAHGGSVKGQRTEPALSANRALNQGLTKYVVEIFSEGLTFEQLRRVHQEIRAYVGADAGPSEGAQRKPLTERNRRLLEIIERNGGAPPAKGQGKIAWWEGIKAEWNAGVPKRERIEDWRAISQSHARLVKRLPLAAAGTTAPLPPPRTTVDVRRKATKRGGRK
jgi:hypothetical protein